MSAAEVLAQHRAFGIDCACGRPINTNADWSLHAFEALQAAGFAVVELPKPGINGQDNRVWSRGAHYVEQEFSGDVIIGDRFPVDRADLAELGAKLLAADAVLPADPPAPKPECRGFQWVGQSFAHCDGCGQPYWEHTHDTRMRDGAGPFDEDPFDYVLITDEQKAACKAKWGDR